MTLNEIQLALSTKKRGTWFTIVYKKVIGDYAKTTTHTVRLVNYYSVANKESQKEPQQGAKKVSNDIHLGNNLIYNLNTHKTRLQVFLTKCHNHKPHSIYEYQGNTIDKEQFIEGTHYKSSAPSMLYTIDISNIVAIY